jgi:acyl-CoA thioesterase-1
MKHFESRWFRRMIHASALVLLAACEAQGAREAAPARAEGPDGAPAVSNAGGPAAATEAPTVVFLGTSLTAGLGLDPEEAYPARVQETIDSAGLPFRVVNAGVSGETSAGARRRIDWILRSPVSVLVVETGANDGLRGLDPDRLRENLEAIVERARRQDPPPTIVLLGMEAPPNYGASYTRRFREVYEELAREEGLIYVPFFLDGVAGVDSLNQGDGIHPTAEGHRIMARAVWGALEPLLRERAGGG